MENWTALELCGLSTAVHSRKSVLSGMSFVQSLRALYPPEHDSTTGGDIKTLTDDDIKDRAARSNFVRAIADGLGRGAVGAVIRELARLPERAPCEAWAAALHDALRAHRDAPDSHSRPASALV